MKRLLAGTLAGSLGWFGVAAAADGLPARPAVSAPMAAAPGTSPFAKVPAVTLGRPVVTLGKPVDLPTTAVTLDRPALLDPGLRRVGYRPQPVVRLQSGDPFGSAPRQSGPVPEAIGPPLGGSLFASDAAPPTQVPGGSFASQSMPSGPIDVGPTGMSEGPIVSGDDFGSPYGEDCDLPCWSRIYGGAEFLFWWIKGTSVPPLATTGPPASFGFLGQPGVSVLYGGSNIGNNEFTGGRFTLGWWCDPCRDKGIEFTYFFLGERTNGFTASSGQFPVLARPFFNVNQGIEFSELTAFPGLGTGVLTIDSRHRFWGGEVNFRCNACSDCWYRLDLLGGVRFLELAEDLNFTERIRVDPAAAAFPNANVIVSDRFGTRNQFYGGQVGADLQLRCNRWTLNSYCKVALGTVHQVVNIQGDQAVQPATGGLQVFQGGLLALPSNSGRFTRDRFAIVPEWGMNLGFNVTEQFRLSVGYSFIYFSNVVRPAEQIDRGLDVNQIPNFTTGPVVAGPTRPIVPFRQTDFWAQGLTFGLEYKY